MGSSNSRPARPSSRGQTPSYRPSTLGSRNPSFTFRRIADNYRSLEEVTHALRKEGLESSNLILGIDFTKSNEWTGKHTFGGRSLHHFEATQQIPGQFGVNPYEEVISIVGRTLEAFDDDKYIPAYGFGDATTGDHSVFCFLPEDQPCYTLEGALSCYRQILPNVNLAGPTSFGPVIRKAIQIVAQTRQYHILVIIADGQVTRSVDLGAGSYSIQEQETIDAICEASNYPLSIVMIGVGDGPWDMMKQFDNALPERAFDNFQFVNFHEVVTQHPANREPAFALRALMEIPEQYKEIQRLRLFHNTRAPTRMITVRPPPPQRFLPPPLPPQQNASFYNQGASFYNNMPSERTSAQPPVQAQVAQQPGWTCAQCTLMNASHARYCSACGSPAPTANAPGHFQPNAPPSFNATPIGVAEAVAISEDKLCQVCQERPKNTVFQCGHQTCAECGAQLQDCCFCRVPITTRIKLFDS